MQETEATPLFTEVQDPSWPIVAAGIGAAAFALYSATRCLAQTARTTTAVLAAGGSGLLLAEFLFPMRTTVLPEEVQVVFGKRTRFRIPGKHIVNAYPRQYAPILEFGGWGIRFGCEGRAFNMRGNRGVQLVLRSGRRVLIGSQQPEALAEAIRKACGCAGDPDEEVEVSTQAAEEATEPDAESAPRPDGEAPAGEGAAEVI